MYAGKHLAAPARGRRAPTAGGGIAAGGLPGPLGPAVRAGRHAVEAGQVARMD